MDIKEIANLSWTKRWESKFCLISASYFAKQYIHMNKKFLGKGFKYILMTHDKGITTCYRVKEETATFGEHLAKLVDEHNELLVTWSDNLKKATDRVRDIIKQPVENFLKLQKYKEFEKSFDEFHPFTVAVNTVPDFLRPEILETYQKELESARTYSESIYNETEVFMRKLLEAIANKQEYSFDLLCTLRDNELIMYLTHQTLPSKESLKKRFEGCALLFYEKKVLFIDDVTQIENMIANSYKKQESVITGKTAYGGIVRGRCKIIFDPERTDDFKKGDILVTGMTRPHFVPLMEKAAAIVTDVGGILSHASLVAREMKKPCVIGTEAATKILKDGDLVEVDATKGVVRKL